MNLLDIIILLFLLFFIYRGYKKGFVIEIFRIVGLTAAILFTSRINVYFVDYVTKMDAYKDYSPYLISVVTGAITFFSLFLIFQIVGMIVTKATNKLQLSIPNKLSGALFGGLKGTLILVILFFIVRLTPANGFLMNMIEDEPPKFDLPTMSDLEEKGKDLLDKSKKDVESLDLKEVSKKALEQVEKLEKVKDAISGDLEVAEVEVSSKPNRSRIGYMIYKISTLLDPIEEDFNKYLAERIDQNLETLENLK